MTLRTKPIKIKKNKLYTQLYFQILVSILIGILLGHFYPQLAIEMKPLGDGFIRLIRMLIAPIIFVTVVMGIAGVRDIKSVGRIGVKALIYFEVVFVVLGLIARFSKFSLWRFLVYIKEELLIVLGTSSSETVLPRMMKKLEAMGCGKSVVGLVLPSGYTFNLDGTSIYLTIATLFVAQALNIDLSLGEQLMVLGVLLLTSSRQWCGHCRDRKVGGGFYASSPPSN